MPRTIKADATGTTAVSYGARRTYSRRSVGRKAKKPSVADLSRQLKRLTKETKPELKFTFHGDSGQTDEVGAGTFKPVVAYPIEGTASDERTGDHVRAKRLDLRLRVKSSLPLSPTQNLAGYPSGCTTARLIVLKVRDAAAAATIACTDYYGSAGDVITGMWNPDEQYNFSVLMDEVIFLGVPQPGQVNSTTVTSNTQFDYLPDGLPLGMFVERSISLNFDMLFDPSTDRPNKNGLYYAILSDLQNSASFEFASKFSFTDV